MKKKKNLKCLLKTKRKEFCYICNKLIIYKNSDGNIIVDAIYKDKTLWLSQKVMSKVFEVGVSVISKHLKNIFEEKELDKDSAYSKMELVQKEDNRNVKKKG